MRKNLKFSKNWRNWWYYYKWYIIGGIFLLGTTFQLIGNALGLWKKSPDYQIAYIGKTNLPSDTVSALEQAFSSISSDFNGDGKVIVQVNQYISGNQNPDPDTRYYEYGSEIALIGDITDCESYFFLMDDPENFQHNFQILASSDGSCPDEMDRSITDKVIAWSDCSKLSEMKLGTYSTTILGQNLSGNNQDILSTLFIGRRCFYTESKTENIEKCSELWNSLIGEK